MPTKYRYLNFSDEELLSLSSVLKTRISYLCRQYERAKSPAYMYEIDILDNILFDVETAYIASLHFISTGSIDDKQFEGIEKDPTRCFYSSVVFNRLGSDEE